MITPKRQLVLEQWDEFCCLYLHKDSPEHQVFDMKVAFFAGAQSVLFKVIQGFAPESEPTEDDLNMMQNVSDELSAFAQTVRSEHERIKAAIKSLIDSPTGKVV